LITLQKHFSEKFSCKFVIQYQCDGSLKMSFQTMVGYFSCFQIHHFTRTSCYKCKSCLSREIALAVNAGCVGHEAIANAYLGHHHIVSGIVRDKGDDELVKEKRF
jgi:hypothetical protein